MAVRHLNELQQSYGSRGLEVIGVACEQTPPGEQRATAVRAARVRYDIRYRLLMNGEQGALKPCPLMTQLGVPAFPTLKLVDERGQVVWECVGLGERHMFELKQEIERRLPLTR